MEIFIVLMNGYPYEARSSRAAAMTLCDELALINPRASVTVCRTNLD